MPWHTISCLITYLLLFVNVLSFLLTLFTEYTLPCTEDVKSCGMTCGKLLACGVHYCTQRCHSGECETCRQLIVKTCRCGRSKREILCTQELRCERKCDNWRNCKRHRCHQKCHIVRTVSSASAFFFIILTLLIQS